MTVPTLRAPALSQAGSPRHRQALTGCRPPTPGEEVPAKALGIPAMLTAGQQVSSSRTTIVVPLLPGPLDQPCTTQSRGNAVSMPKGAPARSIPFAACCCSRILRVRGVVPLGMLMMYFPSISAVTQRRLVGTARLSSSRRARADREEGDGEHLPEWNVLLGWGLDALRRAQMCPLSPCVRMTAISYLPNHCRL